MRTTMNRLAEFLGRRRRWVLAAWVVIVVLALPFASRQTEHLSGGGFDVPGSQSDQVSQALQSEFGSQADGISILLKAAPDASAAERAAAVSRVRAEVATIEELTLPPAAARQARRQLRRTGTAIVPLRSDLSSDQLIDSAGALPDDLYPGTAVR